MFFGYDGSPSFWRQKFMGCCQKDCRIRKIVGPDIPYRSVDGGIDEKTAPIVWNYGADTRRRGKCDILPNPPFGCGCKCHSKKLQNKFYSNFCGFLVRLQIKDLKTKTAKCCSSFLIYSLRSVVLSFTKNCFCILYM